ncbi:MAG: tripartite tricarboxylate transporter TctB family protein [Blautia sp.]|nr:tripartite tricarboxylate transporter TctB family protein [Blautia sp.]
MKKTQTKAFSNLVCAIILLIFEGWAYYETYSFKVQKKAYVQPATFPRVMLIGMIVFTLILLIQSLIKVFGTMKENDPDNSPAPPINPFTNKGVLAALFVVLLCCCFTFFFEKLGYVLISAIICAIIMWMVGKRDILVILLVSILVPLVLWFVFYKLLTVNIPMGVLQPLRDLVDKI